MPELPELEMVRRYLDERCIGKTITGATVNQPACVNVPPLTYERAISGGRIDHVWRKGKSVMVDLSNDVSLVVHLALGGEVLLKDSVDHDPEHTQIVLTFSDGTALHFHQLRLGNVHVFPTYHLAATRIGKLGPDALDDLPDPTGLQAIYGDRGLAIKQLLLDQSLLCGLGNFYADEVLFRARIGPESRGKALGTKDFKRLHAAIREVIDEALRSKQPGAPDFRTCVYGRTDQPCHVCGSPIRHLKIANRSAYVCRKCQRKKSARAKATNPKKA